MKSSSHVGSLLLAARFGKTGSNLEFIISLFFLVELLVVPSGCGRD